MARSRNIKPGFFTNDVLGALPPLARLLFAGLWTIADRAGRLEDRPRRIKVELLPYDDCDADKLLDELHRSGFILRYEAGKVRCIQILAWDKHQHPHINEAPSSMPAPCEHGTSTVQAPESHGSNPADSLLLIPDSLNSVCVSRKGATPPTPGRKKAKTAIPDGFGASPAVREWAAKAGFTRVDDHLAAFVTKVQKHGYTYADWDAALCEAIREDWAKLRHNGHGSGAPPPDARETGKEIAAMREHDAVISTPEARAAVEKARQAALQSIRRIA